MRVVVAAAVVVAGCAAKPAPVVPAEALPYDAEFVASSHRLHTTLARDGIVLDTTPVMRTCEVPTEGRDCARCDVATALDEISPDLIDRMAIAFARYPTSIRKAAQLEHVAFCRALTYERGTDHGPAGLADPATHRVYISVEYFRTPRTGFSIENAVHHEVFHLLDFAALLGVHALDDTEWRKLNPPGFVYLGNNEPGTRPAGFVNTYATTNEAEDRASTFEYLMTQPDELCAIAARDPLLARKVRLVYERVMRVDGAERLGITAPCAKPVTKPAKPKVKRPKRAKRG